MSATRLKSLGKLVVLIGLPVAFVVGLFGAGVYVGHGHRTTILSFERDWLGLDVTVPGEPSKPTSDTAKPEPPKPEPPKPEPPKPEPTTTPEPAKPEPTTTPEPTPKPVETPPKPVETPPPPATGLPVAVAEPAPLPPELQARLGEPLKLRVKVVVDEEVFDRRSDWIDYAERHVRWASQVLLRELGVELELRGVVAWPTAWSSGQVAFADLERVGNDGADLVIGLGGRSIRTPVQAGPTTAKHHATAAIAFSTDPTSPAPHLRSLLRAVTQAMGSDPVAIDADPIAFSAEERRILLERKHLPFTAEVVEDAPPQPADEAAPEGEN
ncbi:hypothetical protein [Nannocystis pusilla]|uniref:hypothetical protein n=1 Tax=Nannocystis pusilla TaxID=889268 RepID=UPI003DA5D400